MGIILDYMGGINVVIEILVSERDRLENIQQRSDEGVEMGVM
jgi:hypothetical protein